MQDVGEVDEETGECFKSETEAKASAEEWLASAMPLEYYPEDFVTIDEGPVEFLGMEPPKPAPQPTDLCGRCGSARDRHDSHDCAIFPTHPFEEKR
jgi:hypothetical protein